MYAAKTRCVKANADYSVETVVYITKDGQVCVDLTYMEKPIPLGTFLAVIGLPLKRIFVMFPFSETSKGILYLNVRDSAGTSLDGHYDILCDSCSRSQTLRGTVTEMHAYFDRILTYDIFPHGGSMGGPDVRDRIVASLLFRLMETFRTGTVSDVDNLRSKRVETSGVLIEKLLFSLLRKLTKRLQVEYNRTGKHNVMNVVSHFDISSKLQQSFQQSDWGMPNGSYLRSGVSQILSRTSLVSTQSHLNRVMVPVLKEMKNVEVRQLHPSTFGMYCMIETPEGKQCGIVRNFALYITVSLGVDDLHATLLIRRACGDALLRTEMSANVRDNIIVFHNGVPIGWTDAPKDVVHRIRKSRKEHLIYREISVAYRVPHNAVYFYSDSGRIMRPLLCIDPEFNLITMLHDMVTSYTNMYHESPVVRHIKLYEELQHRGILQYVDTNEIDYAYIARNLEDVEARPTTYDFCEVHPAFLMGICASQIPFPNNSPAPRNLYMSAMSKQAASIPMTNLRRFDTNLHILPYPQRPLVTTQFAEDSGVHCLPSAQNIVVAICTVGGDNTEDAITINKAAVDRGLFRTFIYRTVTITDARTSAKRVQIGVVPPNLRMSVFDYSQLDEDGIVRIGAHVALNVVVVSRMAVVAQTPVSDSSIVLRKSDFGIVDMVALTYSDTGVLTVKLRIRKQNIPRVGDKFVSAEGQKGTAGRLMATEDMPFNCQGIAPDVVFNPHGIPSRMTINFLLEILAGKTNALSDHHIVDGTAYAKLGQEWLALMKALPKYGYQRLGDEHLIDGCTGRSLDCDVFMGVCSYSTLKHLVESKVHARQCGNVTHMTRQPVEGRQREGGLRIGNMEIDCLESHGVSYFRMERLLHKSDHFVVRVCKQCGIIVHSTPCSCGHSAVQKVELPFAFKLFTQDLQGMGMRVSINHKQRTPYRIAPAPQST
jgi:DNA-directed RNA polymerase II subunit RPB2